MTTIPDAIRREFPDDDGQLNLAAWRRTAHISASKVLHGWCGQPECPFKRPAERVLTCGLPECEQWMRYQPQVFYDHFLPIYNGVVGNVEEEDEDEGEKAADYVITRRMLALFGFGISMAGGTVGALLMLVAGQVGVLWVVTR